MRFKHSGGRGDIVYALPAIRELGGGVLCLDVAGNSHASCPLQDSDIPLFSELLSGQSYIESVEPWDGRPVDVDLDGFRLKLGRDRHLACSHLLAVGREADLRHPWLESSVFELHCIADVIVNRTSRFHGFLNWRELKPWEEKMAFVGTEDEHHEFTSETGLGVERAHTPTLKSVAEAILGSRLFIGNQSFPFALAEAFKHPRVLEIFPNAPNCMPSGANAYAKLSPALLGELLS